MQLDIDFDTCDLKQVHVLHRVVSKVRKCVCSTKRFSVAIDLTYSKFSLSWVEKLLIDLKHYQLINLVNQLEPT